MKDDELEKMKLQYKSIPVPEGLKARVMDSMETAKKELGTAAEPENPEIAPADTAFPKHPAISPADTAFSEQSTKFLPSAARIRSRSKTLSFRKFAVRTAGVAAAAMLVITVLTNSGERIAYAMEDVPFLGAIARIVTFREYNHDQDNMEASIKVPSIRVETANGNPLEESTEELNKQIEAYTSQIIAAYEAEVEASGGQGHEALNLDYEIVTDNDRLFSLRFDETIVMAGSMHSVMIYNLDKTTGKLITLKDLFIEDSNYIAVISDNIKEQMEQQMGAQTNSENNVSYFYETDMPGLNFTEISPDENFYISEAGKLTLVFDKYEIAPGYMGSVEFEIPTEAIADIVKDGFVK